MLIDGKIIGTNDLKVILSKVRQLPGAFVERTARRTDDGPYLQSEAYRFANEGDAIFTKWQSSKLPSHLTNASDIYQSAMKSAEESGDGIIQAITLSRYAEVAPYFTGSLDTCIRYLLDASMLAEQHGAKDFASQYASQLHGVVYSKVKYGIENGIASDQLNPWIKILGDIRQRAAKLFRNQHGEAVDEEAYRIEQGEVGFSDNQKIGTDLLIQCVSPIIRNPKTGLTAFAHIDHGTDITSLDFVLERLGYHHGGEPLQVRLVGGNTEANNGKFQEDFFRSVAGHNIFSLLSYLKDKNVNIISSDIMEKDQPSAIVVDPRTFDLTESVPGKLNPDFFLAQGRAMLSEPGKPLHYVFDLSRSEDRAPVLVTQQLAESLNALAEMPIHSIYEMFTQEGEKVGGLAAERVESVVCLIDNHRKIVNDILLHVGARINELKHFCVSFDNDSVQLIIDSMIVRPIYTGENAEIGNAGLINFVRGDFITLSRDGQTCSVDLGNLESGDFSLKTTVNPFYRYEM